MDPIITHTVAGVVGALVGSGVALLISSRSGSKKSARTLKAEYEEYREKVADHFTRTASAVNQLTDSYKSVFDELQEGAQNLLDEETLRSRLTHDEGEVITLNRLGFQQSNDPASSQPTEQRAPSSQTGEKPTSEGDVQPAESRQRATSDSAKAKESTKTDSSEPSNLGEKLSADNSKAGQEDNTGDATDDADESKSKSGDKAEESGKPV